MSNLLSQASLVMIPSGYKEDVVYSAIPTNGNGDLSFTRASNGTRVNSAGLVEVCPWNLFTYSEQFQNADWIGGGNGKPTMTDNFAVAPNGTMTASKLEAASDGYQIRQNVATPNTQMSVSVWLRTNTGTKTIQLFLNNAVTALQNITVTTTWTRYEISGLVTTLAGDGRNGLYTTEALTSGAYILVWGFQTNLGLTAKPYFPTTDRLNVPRLTYQNGGGGCPSLLLEKQSTNVLLYSEQFDNAAWAIAGGITVTANATTSPDGTQNADLFSHGSFSTYLYQNLGTLSGTITTSIFVKKGSQSSIAFGFVSGGFTGGMSVKFNLDTQTFSTPTNYANFTSISATYQSLGNGWYRLNLTGTTATSDTYYYVLGSLLDSFAVNAYLYGAQLEASSYPTSYIPTTSSSATRVADSCSKTGISSLIGGTSGTIFFDIKTNPVLTTDNYKQFFYYTDSSSNQGYMYLNSGNGIITNPPLGNLSSSITLSPNTRYKIALTYANNDFALYVNGTSVATASSGTPWNFENLLSLGNYQGTSEFNQFVFNQYTHFPSRLTNAELASLTTI